MHTAHPFGATALGGLNMVSQFAVQALIGAATTENSGAVKRAYCSTAAQIVKYSAEGRAAQLAGKILGLTRPQASSFVWEDVPACII